MEAFIPMLKNVILFVLLAVPGYILVKCKALKQEQTGVLSKLLMYVGMPFLIISGTLGISFNKETISGMAFSAILGIILTFGFFFLSKLLSRIKSVESLDPLWNKKRQGIIRFSQIFANNGFLGLPLAAAVFGSSSPVFTYLVVLNIINNVFIYSLGTYLISGDKNTISLKSTLLNPVLLSFIIGIILNLLGVSKMVPELVTFSDHFKNLVTPISMLILGMKLAGIKFSSMFKSRGLYYVSSIKLILFPAIAVALTYLFTIIVPTDSVNLILAMFIAFSMPVAGLATAFADRYDGDTENAVIFTLGTTILSIITIPLLYMLLCFML